MPEHRRRIIIGATSAGGAGAGNINRNIITTANGDQVVGVPGDGLQPYAAAASDGAVQVVDEVKMEAEDHLAREYVQNFVLDHLETGDTTTVKRESHHLVDKIVLVKQQPPSAATATTTIMVNGAGRQMVDKPSGGSLLLSQQQQQQQHLSESSPAGGIGPLTPPAHELEQTSHGLPVYGQPPGAIQVQHAAGPGVLIKSPYVATSLTSLSHPGTPPDTPPVSTSPPHMQPLHRIERMQLQHHHHHQPTHHPQQQEPEAILPDGMPWLTSSLRQEPLDLRPHCPQDAGSEPDVDPEHWPPHHLPDLVQHHSYHPGAHLPSAQIRHRRHGG